MKIINDNNASNVPFISVYRERGDVLIRPTNGIIYSDTEGDSFIPVELKNRKGHWYGYARLHKEIDCDGTFYSAEFQVTWDGEFTNHGWTDSSWDQLKELHLYFTETNNNEF